jgi:hypothetical protein
VFPAHLPVAALQNWLHTAEQTMASQTFACGGAHAPPLELDALADEDADVAPTDDDTALEDVEEDTLELCTAEPPAPPEPPEPPADGPAALAPAAPDDARVVRSPGVSEDDPPCPTAPP